MPKHSKVAAILFPPLWLFPIWRSSRSLWRKTLNTIGVGLISLLYVAFVIFLLIQFAGLQIEWRGGYAPALTWQKTAPNYDALELDRGRQRRPFPLFSGFTNAYWTGFRGPRRNGVYDEGPILTNWPTDGLHLLWRQPIGGGFASFAIANDLAFTLEQRRDNETVAAYQLETGGEVWTQKWPAKFHGYFNEDGPRATPAYSEGKVYALGALGDLHCFESVSGKLLWRRNVLTDLNAKMPAHGVAASPLIAGNRLIVLAGAGRGQAVQCYDKRDGRLLWCALDDAMSYASPMLVTFAGQEQLLVCADTRTVGLGIEDGKLLWEYPWRVLHDQSPIGQPVILSTNRFLLSAGYFTGCAAVEVARTGAGFAARTVWQNKSLKNKFTSSVFWQGHVYGLDEDTLTCLVAATGVRKWRAGRYGYGQLLLADGHLVVLSGDGVLALVRAAPDRYRELARFPAIRGKTWSHPAIAEGKLLVRNETEMACFQISPREN